MTIEDRVWRLSPAHQVLWKLRTGHPSGSASRRQLVAFVVERPGESIDVEDLHLFLQYRLPQFMLPAQIFKVPELPRTAGGKLARSRLQIPETATSQRVSVPPRDETERRLVALFESVLQYRPVGVFDDFFADLGGHSLLAMQLISAIRREWQRDIPLRLIFEQPAIAGLALALRQTDGGPASV